MIDVFERDSVELGLLVTDLSFTDRLANLEGTVEHLLEVCRVHSEKALWRSFQTATHSEHALRLLTRLTAISSPSILMMTSQIFDAVVVRTGRTGGVMPDDDVIVICTNSENTP